MHKAEIKERLKDFLEYTGKNPLPYYVQDHHGDIGKRHFWCSDWWTEEVTRCLLVGIRTYRGLERPDKLYGNEFFVQEHIVNCAKQKLLMMRSLSKIKNEANKLLVCEVGRGLDILVASLVQNWTKVISYDRIVMHGRLISEYFGMGMGMEIDFRAETSERFPFDSINEDIILVANGTQIQNDVARAIQKNMRIKHVIRNGRLLYGRDG